MSSSYPTIDLIERPKTTGSRTSPPPSPHRTPKSKRCSQSLSFANFAIVCPPSPSPLRTMRSPFRKKLKFGYNHSADCKSLTKQVYERLTNWTLVSVPLDGDLSSSITSTSNSSASISAHHNVSAPVMIPNSNTSGLSMMEEADLLGASNSSIPPKITFSSPPSTPPSSPPALPFGYSSPGFTLQPPPCNINPFSPERSKLKTRQSNVHNSTNLYSSFQEEYSPIAGHPSNSANANYSIYASNYEELELIGSGCFGTVYKCRDRMDGWLYAIKISKKKFRGPIDKYVTYLIL